MACCRAASNDVEAETIEPKFYIDGKVKLNVGGEAINENWMQETRIVVDDGQHIGIPKPDGRFRINNLPAGSYVVEATHSKYSFEPIRVDINSRGKRRARQLDRQQPSDVRPLPYPLRLTARRKTVYFAQRNTWTINDILRNPTTTALFLPVLLGLLLLLMPQLNLPELLDADNKQASRHVQDARDSGNGGRVRLPWNDLPMPQMPDFSELVMRWLGDWPADKDQSTSSGKPNKTGRRKKAAGSSKTPRHPELFDDHSQVQSVSSTASAADDNAMGNGSRPSASRRKKRNKKKK